MFGWYKKSKKGIRTCVCWENICRCGGICCIPDCICSLCCVLLFLMCFLFFILAVICATWLIVYFIFVDMYATAIRDSTFGNIETYLENNLRVPPALSVGLSSYLVESYDESNRTEKVYTYLFRSFSRAVSQIEGDFMNVDYVVDFDNDVIMHQLTGSKSTINYFVYNNVNKTMTKYLIANLDTGTLSNSSSSLPYTLPSLESIALDNPNEGIWNEPYIECELDDDKNCLMYIEYEYNVVEKSKYLGTSRVSIAGRTISNFLRSITRADSFSFVIHMKTEELIASSTVVSEFGKTNQLGNYSESGEDPTLFKSWGFPHSEVIKEVSNSLFKLNEIKDNVNGKGYFWEGMGVVPYWVDFVIFEDYNWVLVHVLPFWAVFLTPFLIGLSTVLFSICCCCFACCCNVGVIFSINKSIKSLKKNMKRARKMKLDKVNRSFGIWYRFKEIREMRKSFYKLVDELRKYRAFLPDELVLDAPKRNFGIVSAGWNYLFSRKDSSVSDGFTGSDMLTVATGLDVDNASQGSLSSAKSNSTASSKFSTRYNYRRKRIARMKFSVGLMPSHCTILTFNFVNSADLVNVFRSLFVKLHSEITKTVRNTVLRFSGVLFDFDDRYFKVKFEGYDCENKAMNCALKVMEEIDKFNKRNTQIQGSDPIMTIRKEVFRDDMELSSTDDSDDEIVASKVNNDMVSGEVISEEDEKTNESSFSIGPMGIDPIEQKRNEMADTGRDGIVLVSGLASGMVLQGNLGSARVKRKILVGDVIKTSKFLAEYCEIVGVPYLLDQQTVSKCSPSDDKVNEQRTSSNKVQLFVVKPVDIVFLVSSPNPLKTLSSDEMIVFEFKERYIPKDDEWMYEMEKAKRGARFDLLKTAFIKLSTYYNEAKVSFEEYLHNFPGDKHTQKVYNNAERFMKYREFWMKLMCGRQDLQYMSLLFNNEFNKLPDHNDASSSKLSESDYEENQLSDGKAGGRTEIVVSGGKNKWRVSKHNGDDDIRSIRKHRVSEDGVISVVPKNFERKIYSEEEEEEDSFEEDIFEEKVSPKKRLINEEEEDGMIISSDKVEEIEYSEINTNNLPKNIGIVEHSRSEEFGEFGEIEKERKRRKARRKKKKKIHVKRKKKTKRREVESESEEEQIKVVDNSDSGKIEPSSGSGDVVLDEE